MTNSFRGMCSQHSLWELHKQHLTVGQVVRDFLSPGFQKSENTVPGNYCALGEKQDFIGPHFKRQINLLQVECLHISSV